MATLNRPIDVSHFSPADWKRLTDYVAILIAIDRKLRKKASLNREGQVQDK